MGFRDFFNKSKDFLVDNITETKKNIKNKYDNIIEYDMFTTSSENIKGLKKYVPQNEYPSDGREAYILGLCLNINSKRAKEIDEIIPISESIIKVNGALSSKSNIYYYIVVTDKKIWIINDKEYATMMFSEINCFKIINTSIMNQYVNFNNIAFNFNCIESDILYLRDLILNNDFRKQKIEKITANLCGITPIEQYLTKNYVGISIDNLDNVILHNGFNEYHKISIDQINEIILLVDNYVVIKKSKLKHQGMLSALNDCHTMTLKIITNDNEYKLNILVSNSLYTLIKKEDSRFINSYDFSKKIIERLSIKL